jgi:4-hydroxybenzoate polyprenyltransferase
VNEPYRPIPSGAISEGEVTFQAWFLFLSAMALSYELDQWAGNDWPVIFACSVRLVVVGQYVVLSHLLARWLVSCRFVLPCVYALACSNCYL